MLTVVPVQLAAAGLGPVERGLLLAVPGVPAAFVSLWIGPITARFGATRVLRCAFALWTAGFIAVAVHPAVIGIAVALVPYGLGEGLALPTLQDRVMQRAPAGARGGVVACYVAATRLGATAGPLLAVPFVAGGTIRAAFAAGAVVAALLAVTATARASASSQFPG